MREFPVTTICGSMRYFDRMMEVAHELTKDGWIVLMPFVHVISPEEQKISEVKAMLDEMHFRKIDMSSAIHVVGEYKGHSTTTEIAYATNRGKIVFYIV